MRISLFGIMCLFRASLVTAEPASDIDLSGHPLTLQEAMSRAIAKNLDVQTERLNISIKEQDLTVEDAAFDPTLEAGVHAGDQRILTGSVLFRDSYSRTMDASAWIGVRKRFLQGLQGRMSLETGRSENNSLADALDPQYRTLLVFQLTQPLLRDFGAAVNATGIAIAKNHVKQAVYGYVTRAEDIAESVETAYVELAKALAVVLFRKDSRSLAMELLEGNREREKNGRVSVTEVDHARAAVAARDEAVISAIQQAETVSNRLKDLLEIRAGDPLHRGVLTVEPLPPAEEPIPSQEEAFSEALKNQTDLKQLHLAVEAQRLRMVFLENQRLPRLDLNATLGLNGLSGDDRPVMLFGSPTESDLSGDYADSVSGLTEGDGYQWSVDLRFSYPIGDRAGEARVLRSAAEKRQLLYRLKRLEGGVETRAETARIAAIRSQERVRVAEHLRRLAGQTLDQEMARLTHGLSDTFRVLTFQEDRVAADIRWVTAACDFHQAMARLYRAMGVNLSRHHIAAEVNVAQIPAFRESFPDF